MPSEALERLVERLEQTAAALRNDEIDAERAASLVDECAQLAAQAGAELDRLVRGDAAPPAGQLPLT
jgi:exonuclease VII small subunit